MHLAVSAIPSHLNSAIGTSVPLDWLDPLAFKSVELDYLLISERQGKSQIQARQHLALVMCRLGEGHWFQLEYTPDTRSRARTRKKSQANPPTVTGGASA